MFNFSTNKVTATSSPHVQVNLGHKKRFHVSGPAVYNSLVKGIPKRDYLSALNVYEAPAITGNVRYLLSLVDDDRVRFSTEARAHLRTMSKKILAAPERAPFPPHPFKLEPWPYQRRCLDFIWSLRTAFIDADMGLGKSLMSLSYHCAKYLAGEIDAILILGPKNTRYNWLDEIVKHVGVPVDAVVAGAQEDPRDVKPLYDRSNKKLKILLVGVESLSSTSIRTRNTVTEFCEFFGGRLGAILDEAHMIKNTEAKRTKFLAGLRGHFSHSIAMTGTPIGSDITDLFAYYEYLNPDILGLGSPRAFKNRYCEFDDRGDVIGYKNEPELRDLLQPWTFAARKADCLPDLPPVSYTRRYVELLPVQWSAIRAIDSPSIRNARNDGEVFRALAALSRQQQIVEGYTGEIDRELTMQTGTKKRCIKWMVDPDKSPKLLGTLDAINEWGDKPVVVWCKYTASLEALYDMMCSAYGHRSVVTYYGATSDKNREINRRAFMEHKARIFLANVECASTGLNGLTVASHAIYEANTFKVISRQQSEARVHRPGAKDPVLYTDIAARGTIDVSILRSLERKQNLQDFLRDVIHSKNQDEI